MSSFAVVAAGQMPSASIRHLGVLKQLARTPRPYGASISAADPERTSIRSDVLLAQLQSNPTRASGRMPGSRYVRALTVH
jgi:hypothetical protein